MERPIFKIAIRLLMALASCALIAVEFIQQPEINDRLVLSIVALNFLFFILLSGSTDGLPMFLSLVSLSYYYFASVNYPMFYLPLSLFALVVLFPGTFLHNDNTAEKEGYTLINESPREYSYWRDFAAGWMFILLNLIPMLLVSSVFYTPLVTSISPLFLALDFAFIALCFVSLGFSLISRCIIPWILEYRQRKLHLPVDEHLESSAVAISQSSKRRPSIIRQNTEPNTNISISRWKNVLRKVWHYFKMITGGLVLPYLHLIAFIPYSVIKLVYFIVYAPSFFFGKDQGYDAVIGLLALSSLHVYLYVLLLIARVLKSKLFERTNSAQQEEQNDSSGHLWISQPLTAKSLDFDFDTNNQDNAE